MKPGQALQAMKQQKERLCHTCGECFWSVNEAKYCSGSCRSKASRERNKVYFDAVCPACQSEMLLADKRVIYCSVSCRMAAQSLRY